MYITGNLQKHSIQLDCLSWNTGHFLKGTHSNDLQQREIEPKAIPVIAAVGSKSLYLIGVLLSQAIAEDVLFPPKKIAFIPNKPLPHSF